MKPICVGCRRFYKPLKNGAPFVEGMPLGRRDDPACKWTPYKLWMGDLWSCPGCGHQLLVGVSAGQKPLAEHFEDDFTEQVRKCEPIVQINDC